MHHPMQPRRAVRAADPHLVVYGATLHNLQNLTVQVPLHRMVAVTDIQLNLLGEASLDELLNPRRRKFDNSYNFTLLDYIA